MEKPKSGKRKKDRGILSDKQNTVVSLSVSSRNIREKDHILCHSTSRPPLNGFLAFKWQNNPFITIIIISIIIIIIAVSITV
jgi:hypothetical protein